MKTTKWKSAVVCSHCNGTGRIVNPKWLRLKRKRAGLTLAAMGNMIGVSDVMIYYVETGKHVPGWILKKYETL